MQAAEKDNQAFHGPGRLVIRDIPLWKDTIPGQILSRSTVDKDFISAGWLLSKMDLGAGMAAHSYIKGRAVTVAVDAISFPRPVKVGDTVSFYTSVVAQGRSSLVIRCESWARRKISQKLEKVTEGLFTFVALDQDGKPVAIKTPKSILPAPSAKRDKLKKKAVNEAALWPTKAPTLVKTTTDQDKNYYQDIFGGWLLDHMDLAGLAAVKKMFGRLGATRAIEAMIFKKAVYVGDEISFFTECVKIGQTSVTMKIDAWASRTDGRQEKVTEGLFTYVAVDEKRKPVAIK